MNSFDDLTQCTVNQSRSYRADSAVSRMLGCLILWLFTLGAFCGCTTHAHRLANPRHAFFSNDLNRAHTQLSKLIQKPKNDETVIELDLALVEMLQGNLHSAEQRMRKIRDQWDHLEKKSLLEETASVVTDDRRRAYAGEDYEKLLLRVSLTLSSLLQDGVDAESYSLQTLDKQRELQNKAEERWGDEVVAASYCVPPIAPYMRGILQEATWNNYAEAAKFYEETSVLLPEHPYVLEDLQRAKTSVHSQPQHGVVYVVAMVGRGPYKEEVNAQATQQALLIADQILSAVSKYSVPPTIAPVKVPTIVSPPKPFDLIGIDINGQARTTTLPITDLHQLAVSSYEAKRTEVIARAVARRVIKKGAVYAAKDHFEASSDIASLAMDAAGVLWEATEAADTRCWGLLPREIQMVRLELPAGSHLLSLAPITAGKPVAKQQEIQVDVKAGRNTYVLGYWPGLQPIGELLIR